MHWSKKICTFYDGLHVLYHIAKFGEDRTTRAGCRFENMVFVTMFFCLSRSEAGSSALREMGNII